MQTTKQNTGLTQRSPTHNRLDTTAIAFASCGSSNDSILRLSKLKGMFYHQVRKVFGYVAENVLPLSYRAETTVLYQSGTQTLKMDLNMVPRKTIFSRKCRRRRGLKVAFRTNGYPVKTYFCSVCHRQNWQDIQLEILSNNSDFACVNALCNCPDWFTSYLAYKSPSYPKLFNLIDPSSGFFEILERSSRKRHALRTDVQNDSGHEFFRKSLTKKLRKGIMLRFPPYIFGSVSKFLNVIGENNYEVQIAKPPPAELNVNAFYLEQLTTLPAEPTTQKSSSYRKFEYARCNSDWCYCTYGLHKKCSYCLVCPCQCEDYDYDDDDDDDNTPPRENADSWGSEIVDTWSVADNQIFGLGSADEVLNAVKNKTLPLVDNTLLKTNKVMHDMGESILPDLSVALNKVTATVNSFAEDFTIENVFSVLSKGIAPVLSVVKEWKVPLMLMTLFVIAYFVSRIVLDSAFIFSVLALICVWLLNYFGIAKDVVNSALNFMPAENHSFGANNLSMFLFPFIAVIITGQVMKSGMVSLKGLTYAEKIPRAIRGTIDFAEQLREAVNYAHSYIKDLLYGESGITIDGGMSDCVEFQEEVEQLLLTPDLENAIKGSRKICDQIENLYIKGLAFWKRNPPLDRKLLESVNKYMQPLSSVYTKVQASPVYSSKMRAKPMCVLLDGKSSIGKSELIKFLCKDLLHEIKPGIDNINEFIYARASEQEFWDGYANQPITIFDDFMQRLDSLSNPNAELFEVIRAVNCFPYSLHMASLVEKANSYFSSKIVLLTSNETLLSQRVKSLTCADALLNRISFPFEVLIDESVQNVHGGLDLDKLEKFNERTGFEGIINLNIYRFRELDLFNGRTIAGPTLTYNELVLKLRKQLRRTLNREDLVQQQVLKYNVVPAENQALFSTVDIEKVEAEEFEVPVEESQHLMVKALQKCRTGLQKAYDAVKEHPWLTAIGAASLIVGMISIFTMPFNTGKRVKNAISKYSRTQSPKNFENKPVLTKFMAAQSPTVSEVKPQVTSFIKSQSPNSTITKPMINKFVQSQSPSSSEIKMPRQNFVKSQFAMNQVKMSSYFEQDKNCLDIVERVRNNTLQLFGEDGDQIVLVGNIIALQGKIALMPRHYLCAAACFKNFYITKRASFDHIIPLPYNCFETAVEMKDKDLAAFFLGDQFPSYPDLMKYIPTLKDLQKLEGVPAVFAETIVETVNHSFRKRELDILVPNIECLDSMCVKTSGFDDMCTVRNGYGYFAPSQRGVCGSSLVVHNSQVRQKLIGLHTAQQLQTGQCYAQGLVFEELRDLISVFPQKYRLIYNTEWMNTAENQYAEGNFTVVGALEKPVINPGQSKLVKSPIFEQLGKSEMAPAVLRPIERNGEMIDPLKKGLEKAGVNVCLVPKDLTDMVASYNLHLHLSSCGFELDQYQRILSFEEAVCGVEGDDFIQSMSRTTSAGWPYTMTTKLPGKMDFFSDKETYDLTGSRCQELREDVSYLIECALRGEKLQVYLVDTLKDEKRKLSKIENVETRVFSVGPLHYNILYRMYFGGYIASKVRNRHNNFHAVGTDHNTEWEDLYRRLQSKSQGMGSVFAGDFSNFDGTLNAQFGWSNYEQNIEPFYQMSPDWHPNDQRIREALMDAKLHSLHICGDIIALWNQSQGSGNVDTVNFNCDLNVMYHMAAWVLLGHELKKFKDHVYLTVYGDDSVVNVSEIYRDSFNATNISQIFSEFGLKYTNDQKTTVFEDEDMSTITYLKRSFKYDSDFKRIIAPLNLTSCNEMLNWLKKGPNMDVQLALNIERALQEYALHGSMLYNYQSKRIRDVIRRYRWSIEEPYVPSFSEQLRFWNFRDRQPCDFVC